MAPRSHLSDDQNLKKQIDNISKKSKAILKNSKRVEQEIDFSIDRKSLIETGKAGELSRP